MNEDNEIFRSFWGCLKIVLNDYNIDCEHITSRMGEHLVEDFMDSMIRTGHVARRNGMIDDKNPCDCCNAKDKASGCENCVLYTIVTYGECQNDKCFCNYECGCLLSLDDTCKASTCYGDDYRDHDCKECEKFTVNHDEDGCEYYTCGENGAQIGKYDSACEYFKEREE